MWHVANYNYPGNPATCSVLNQRVSEVTVLFILYACMQVMYSYCITLQYVAEWVNTI